MWGLLDTKENCWMGNKTGPLLYEDETLAKVAARVVDVQLKQSAGRTRAILYDQSAIKLKDEKEVLVSAEKAIERLESGLEL